MTPKPEITPTTGTSLPMIPGRAATYETGFVQSPTNFTSSEIFRSIGENVFRNLLPNTLGRVDAHTSWAYSGMGAGLSKSAFGATMC